MEFPSFWAVFQWEQESTKDFATVHDQCLFQGQESSPGPDLLAGLFLAIICFVGIGSF